MKTADMTTANTILAQLGGNRFIAMTGAKNLLGSADALQFRIGAGAKRGINSVVVKLEADDTYTVTFYKIAPRAFNVTEIAVVSSVYADSLRSVFTKETDFLTSL